MIARAALCCAIGVVLMAGACHPRPPAHERTISPDAIHSDPRFGFSVRIPQGWIAHASDQFALVLLPAADSHGAGGVPPATLSIDVPRLPPHLPGMIRLSLVRNGFVNDLKERFDDVAVVEETAIDLPDAQARMLLLSWRDDGRTFRQRAVLIIHAGRVYILRGTAPAAAFEAVDRAFDALLRSLQWT